MHSRQKEGTSWLTGLPDAAGWTGTRAPAATMSRASTRSAHATRATWDYYGIGGRRDGRMLGLAPLPDAEGRPCETLERNACPVQELRHDWVPVPEVAPYTLDALLRLLARSRPDTRKGPAMDCRRSGS